MSNLDRVNFDHAIEQNCPNTPLKSTKPCENGGSHDYGPSEQNRSHEDQTCDYNNKRLSKSHELSDSIGATEKISERDLARKNHIDDDNQWKRIKNDNNEIKRLKEDLARNLARLEASQVETNIIRQNTPITIQNDIGTPLKIDRLIGRKRKSPETAFTAPVSYKTFILAIFVKIVANLSTPCVQILRALHQEVIVYCPKGVGISLEAKLNQYVLANANFFNGIFRVNPESETFPDFFSNFKSADGQHVITHVDLKCGKNGSFDLSRLELLFKDMAKPGGVYKKLFQTMYIITFYCFDENTGQVKPEPPVLKYIHELTARSRTRLNQTFEMMSIGGSSVNLRPTGCTINTYKDIGADRTRADFIEIVLETLFSAHPRCQHIRKKISIKEKGKEIEDCRWEWHTSIVTQVLDLQRRGLFVRTIRDSFETNGIEHKTGLNHNK